MPSIRGRLVRAAAAAINQRPRVMGFLLSKLADQSRAFTMLRHGEFRPVQRRSEIVALCNLIKERQDSNILEIGTYNGGTTLLLAAAVGREPSAKVVTIDIEPRYDELRLVEAAPTCVHLDLIVGDSTAAETVTTATQAAPDGYDVVFIDGDHSYAGVRADTMRYAPLARPGGIIVFHDIQPVAADDDDRLYVGGVPTWWEQIRGSAHSHAFVDEAAQSGFGIGVIELPPNPDGCRGLLEQWSRLATKLPEHR